SRTTSTSTTHPFLYQLEDCKVTKNMYDIFNNNEKEKDKDNQQKQSNPLYPGKLQQRYDKMTKIHCAICIGRIYKGRTIPGQYYDIVKFLKKIVKDEKDSQIDILTSCLNSLSLLALNEANHTLILNDNFAFALSDIFEEEKQLKLKRKHGRSSNVDNQNREIRRSGISQQETAQQGRYGYDNESEREQRLVIDGQGRKMGLLSYYAIDLIHILVNKGESTSIDIIKIDVGIQLLKDVIPDEERYKDVDLSENINNRIERGIKLADIIEGIIRKLL
ncbi:MAG: hypothetical protein EZS28_024278, partial [Streblomastix strix]